MKTRGILSSLVLLAGLAGAAGAQGFTRAQIHQIIDPNNGAEARAQYFYHYFKPDRPATLKPPAWVDEVLPGMIKRPVWQDPEEGVLNEAQLWQAPVSVLYEFFEHTRKTFPPEFNGSMTPPYALIKDYEDSRVRFQMALDRLYRARLGDSLGGRGRAVIANFQLILNEMDSVLDALTSQDPKLYVQSVMAVASLTQQSYAILQRAPRGYAPPMTQQNQTGAAAPMLLEMIGVALLFVAAWLWGSMNSGWIWGQIDERVEKSRRWAQDFNRQFLAVKVEYMVFGPIVGGFLLGILTLNIWGFILLTVMGVYVGAHLPEWILNVVRYRRGKRVEAQLMDAMILMSNALKSGLDIVQGFELVQRDLVPPISEEFGLVLKNYSLGTSFEKALGGMEERIASRLLSYMIKAVIIQRSVGGNLTKIFDRIVENIREEGKLEEKAQALTAQQRIQSMVVGFMPWAMLVLMWIFQPQVMSDYYFTPLGVLTVVFCAFWMTIGMGIVRKLADIQV
ncbi:MAG: type II secretion system F family protein [Elusimicrobia bacterium]|nr:type II secretion system F family protein [Elusimicrobiota bacterium]